MGCWVVQKAIDQVTSDQRADLIDELPRSFGKLRCLIHDRYGNHVLQKAVERGSPEYVHRFVAMFQGQMAMLAADEYGCRVIQRLLECPRSVDKSSILSELRGSIGRLVVHPFGNYVVHKVLENGATEDWDKIVEVIQREILILSKNKYASRVVEKVFESADDILMTSMFDKMFYPWTRRCAIVEIVEELLQDPYGNYVIREQTLSVCHSEY